MSSSFPKAQAAMLIRRSIDDVFIALTDPEQTTHFWFTHADSVLQQGKTTLWEWRQYGVKTNVHVIELRYPDKIRLQWPRGDGDTTVEWNLSAHSTHSCFVEVCEYGFAGSADEIIAQLIDSTEGFTLVLAGAKAWLEHGLELHLVSDRFPPKA